MHNNDSLFIFISGIYSIVLYIISLARSPRFMDISTGRAYYDKLGISNYLKFLAIVLVITIVLGYAITRSMKSTLEIEAIDMSTSAFIGINIFLLHFKDQSRTKNENHTSDKGADGSDWQLP